MDNDVQLYKTIENDIREKIRTGAFLPGDKLPSEMEMMELYQASKMTIRKSISNLEKEGLIYSIQRVGNYVSTPISDQYILHFDETKKIKGLDRIEMLTNAVLSTEQTEIVFPKLISGTRVYMIKRIFFSDEIPIAIDKKLIPYHKDQLFSKEELTKGSFATLMASRLEQYTLNHALTIEAVHCPDEVFPLLEIPPRAPVARITQRYYTENNELAGTSSTYCLPDYMELDAESI